ncbi:MAG: methionine--tRNA ligase, partial [Lutibacter sp.]
EFDDFTKLDIRVGTIIEAIKVPKTKKLLQLKVDVGIDVRTIISGIAESFNAEDIIGQKVTVLVNLAPRILKGIESQGMILMTNTPDGKLAFIEPENDVVANGAQIS